MGGKFSPFFQKVCFFNVLDPDPSLRVKKKKLTTGGPRNFFEGTIFHRGNIFFTLEKKVTESKNEIPSVRVKKIKNNRGPDQKKFLAKALAS